MNELDIVNAMLRLESQLPVNSLDDDHPTLPLCRGIIQESRKSLLAKGWWFNTQRLELVPNAQGLINVPDSFITVREVCQNPSTNLSVSGGFLYDLSGQSLDRPLWVEAVLDLPLSMLPYQAQEVVYHRSRLIYAQDIIKDPTEADVALRGYNEAMTTLSAENIRQAQHNPNHTSAAWRVRRAYRRNLVNRGGW